MRGYWIRKKRGAFSVPIGKLINDEHALVLEINLSDRNEIEIINEVLKEYLGHIGFDLIDARQTKVISRPISHIGNKKRKEIL